nr:SpoIID/LytB domain-containing protein [Geodermatophilaceae bacterium]
MRESQPVRSARRFLWRRLAALIFSVTMLGFGSAASPAPVAAGGSCLGFQNYVTPPNFIYVLRQSGPARGHRQKVDMRQWTKHVVGTQMPGYYPRETLRAQAVFVKQYGWYYAMKGHWRGGRDVDGLCYDIKDAGDGWYIPEQRGYTRSQSDAVDATWD